MIFSLKSSFDLSDKRTLMVGADRAVLYQYRGGRLARSYVFGADQAGFDHFRRYLGETRRAPVYVLVDIVEEEYRQDVIPHVFGADRRSVLDRKYARLFRGTDYHHALLQGRETEGRRDDKVLLTALTRPEVIAPWIDRLREHKVPIAGIYSLALLGEVFLRRIKANGPNVLLISVQSLSGLRQTFFRDQQFKLSRLASMPRLGSVPYAAHLVGEVQKLRRYLNSLGLVSPEAGLDIYILSHGELLTELERECTDSVDENYYLIDVADLAARLGISAPMRTPYSDGLFAQILVDAAPRNHYATRGETRYFTFYQAKRALTAASLLLLLGSMGWGGFNFIEAVSLKAQALDAQEKADFYGARYQMARQGLPPTPVEPRAIKGAVDIVATLQKHKSSPLPMLAAISQALDRAPDVQVDEIDWFASDDPNARTQDRRSRDPRPAMTPAEKPAVERDPKYSHYHIATLRGHFAAFGGDYRRAIADVDALVQALGAHAGMRHVEVVEYPIDVDSGASLSGTATEVAATPAAHFTLRLVLGIADAITES